MANQDDSDANPGPARGRPIAPLRRERAVDRRVFLKLGSLFGLAGVGVSLLAPGEARAAEDTPWEPIPGGEGFAMDLLQKSEGAALLADWLAAQGLALDSKHILLFQIPAADSLPAGIALEDLPSLYAESVNASMLQAASGSFTPPQIMALNSAGSQAFRSDMAALMSIGGSQAAAPGCCCCCCCCCCSCCSSSSSGGGYADDSVLFATFGFTPCNGAALGVKGGLTVNDDGTAVAHVIHYMNDDGATLLKVIVGTIDDKGALQERSFTPETLEQLGPEVLAGELWG